MHAAYASTVTSVRSSRNARTATACAGRSVSAQLGSRAGSQPIINVAAGISTVDGARLHAASDKAQRAQNTGRFTRASCQRQRRVAIAPAYRRMKRRDSEWPIEPMPQPICETSSSSPRSAGSLWPQPTEYAQRLPGIAWRTQ